MTDKAFLSGYMHMEKMALGKDPSKYSIINNQRLMPQKPRIRNKPIEHESMANYINRIESDPTLSRRKKREILARMFGDMPPPGVKQMPREGGALGFAGGGGVGLLSSLALLRGSDMSNMAKSLIGLGMFLGGGSVGSRLMTRSEISPPETTGDYSKWNLM